MRDRLTKMYWDNYNKSYFNLFITLKYQYFNITSSTKKSAIFLKPYFKLKI